MGVRSFYVFFKALGLACELPQDLEQSSKSAEDLSLWSMHEQVVERG